ncbi:MAG: acyl-CoA thioesterase [Cytophagales bacterium]|nr:MAG: acyl-CoA thioesterase [Cytophagales bacterium]
MFVNQVQVRVRYADTDQMGYVYYGKYASFYEIARVEALRNIGVSYKALEEQGVMMPVLENHSHYLQPAQFDDLLTIKVSIRQMPSAKIIFHYEIYNEASQLIHRGETVLVFISKATRKIVRPPSLILEVLKPYFGL